VFFHILLRETKLVFLPLNITTEQNGCKEGDAICCKVRKQEQEARQAFKECVVEQGI